MRPATTMTTTAPLTPDWAAETSDNVEDVDEPPEPRLYHPSPTRFQRSAVRRPNDQPSLLTKAIMGQHEEETHDVHHHFNQRRRSMMSNISLASTADLTSDTGFTSPSRASTPSPPLPDLSSLRLNGHVSDSKAGLLNGLAQPIQTQEAPKEAPRRRCIQFACAAKPVGQGQLVPAAQPMVKTPSAQEANRRTCIKFACPARPASTQNTPPKPHHNSTTLQPLVAKSGLSSTPRRDGVRQFVNKEKLARPQFLRADSKDLIKDGSQFHEFASGLAREDDWIRSGNPIMQKKLTIHDTLTKENHIRRLADEVEEEAEMEEAENEDAEADDDEDDDDDDDDEIEELNELDNVDLDDDENDEDGDGSDGYYTDEETGFADSDEDDDGDENLILWTPSRATNLQTASTVTLIRRPSVNEQQSDSSAATNGSRRRTKARRIRSPAQTPDLPDSTDFVCGTLDEDRPLEEAYMTCLAARRNEKLRLIPQDIDPSFPASDPEDDDEENVYNPVQGSDDDAWVQGVMEDLHQDQDRSRRRRKSEQASPRKFHSPPPKPRGRSPKLLFDRHSPRRVRSPAPKAMTTPSQTPHQGAHVKFHLGGRPGTTQTKSLPRPAALFRHTKRNHKQHNEDAIHIRGAIDIVKGLERKRQRRKEKFYSKYCNRARRGQIPERKPLPGRGAERMRELGLLMAGKKDPGNYVLSV